MNLVPTVKAKSGCSNSTLNSSYRYSSSGSGFPVAGPIHPAGATLPFASVGIATFNGDGTFSGSDTISLSGNTIPRAFTGTYTVNSDCTGSMTFNFFSPSAGSGPANVVVGSDGSGFLFIGTATGATVVGEAKKQ